ncbi:MAG: hypothetical protein HZA17_13710 [Nitrospirae bacterium]|nr:hypothetical protein [Nitrospirota bacterium]
MNWYVIYTKPKAEDSTAGLLENAGIETLSPKVRAKKYIRKKFTEVVEQLFPCYIFACFDKEKHGHMITYTRGVRYIVGRQSPVPVPPEIIEAIRERIEDGIIKPLPEIFKKGDRVIIREGPFRDFYGIFDRDVTGKERVMILLEALHSKLDIEIESIRKA